MKIDWASKRIAIDYETHLISTETPVPKPVCLSYFDGTNAGLIIDKKEMEFLIKKALESGMELIAQNMTFEALVTLKYLDIDYKIIFNALANGQFFCTLIYEKLLNNVRVKENKQLSLDKLVLKYFKKDISDTKAEDAWRTNYIKLEGVPIAEWPQEAIDYAINDSIWAYKIREIQIKEYELKYNSAVKDEIMLNIAAKRGMLVDKDRAYTLKKELEAHLTPMYEYLIDNGFAQRRKKDGKITKNIKSLQQYVKANFKGIKHTPKGNIDVKGETLNELLAEDPENKILRTFLNIKDYEKALTTYANRLIQADPYIYTDYNAVLATNRTSSRQSKFYPSVNIQNQPREVKNVTYDIRNCFIPRPGYKLVSIDYGGLELLSCGNQLLKIFGTSAMADVINSGDFPVDLHSKFGAFALGISYEEFLAGKKTDPKIKSLRQFIKAPHLGFPGGIGYDVMRSLLVKQGIFPNLRIIETFKSEHAAKAFWYQLRQECDHLRIKRVAYDTWAVVFDELVGLKRKMFDMYPELETFLKKTHFQYETGKTAWQKNDWGEWEKEPMHLYEVDGFVRDNCTYTALCNGLLMQSPSACGAKRMVSNLVEHYYESSDVIILAFIHDEIVAEVKDTESAEQHVADMSEIMIDSMHTVLPNVRISVEASYMDYWMKSGGIWEKTFFKNAIDKQLTRELQYG